MTTVSDKDLCSMKQVVVLTVIYMKSFASLLQGRNIFTRIFFYS